MERDGANSNSALILSATSPPEPTASLCRHAQVIRNVIDEAVLADQLGVDFIGLGEHHRPDFAISAPEVVLAAIAAPHQAHPSRLGGDGAVAPTIRSACSSASRRSTPLSNGRAEVILGRGSFTEILSAVRLRPRAIRGAVRGEARSVRRAAQERAGDLEAARTRPPLTNQRVFPPIETGTLKVWIGVGGSPESVVRAAHYDLPLMLAIIGGDPNRFKPYVDLYHRAFAQFGRPAREIGVHSHGYVAETDETAREELWPDYKTCATGSAPNAAGRRWRRAEFDREAEQRLALCRLAGNRGAQDCGDREGARHFPLRHEILAPARCRTTRSCAASSFTARK